MKMKKITRRNFLKFIGVYLIGAAVLPFEKFFNSSKKPKKTFINPKEAKYYTTANDLAG